MTRNGCRKKLLTIKGVFMMKKMVTLSALGLALLLAGCGNTVDNSGKKPSTTKATTSKVSKKDTREVTNGELLKVGQWTKDDSQGKITLAKIWAPKTSITDGPVKFMVESVKILKVMPQNDNQLTFAKDTFQTNSITKPYYELQVVYNLQNSSDQEVQFNGIKAIVTTTGQQLSMDSGLEDEGVGTAVAAKATKRTVAVGLLNEGDASKIKDITVTLDSVSDTENYEDISEGTDAVKIKLEQ